MSLIWCSKKSSSNKIGLCSHLFGLTSVYCIANDIGSKFQIKWINQPSIEGVLSIKQHHHSGKDGRVATVLNKTDKELMAYFEYEDVEKKFKNKNFVIPTTHNLYQHFCYNRPEFNYKQTFLSALINLFHKIFRPEPNLLLKIPPRLSNAIGIHVKVGDSDRAYISKVLVMCRNFIETMNHGKKVFLCTDNEKAIPIAREVFEDDFTLIYNSPNVLEKKNPSEYVLLDLLCMSKCQTLYISWFSDFSRLSALLSPYRQFYSYNHPRNKGMYKCPLNELLCYYNPVG